MLTEKERKIRLRLANIVSDGEFGITKELNDLEDKINSVEELSKEAVQKAEQAVAIAEQTRKTEVIGPMGPVGVQGLTGPQGEKGDSIVGPQGPAGPQGTTGHQGDQGQAGPKGVIGHAGQDGKNIDESIVLKTLDGFRKELETLKKKPTNISGGIVGRDFFKDIDISSQLDGVIKTFNLPAIWNIISVDLSSAPYGALRKGTDYTYTPTSITFTSEIDASTQLASGQSCILTVVL